MKTKFFRDLIPGDVFFYGESASASPCRVIEPPKIESDGLMFVEHANGWTREKSDTLVRIKDAETPDDILPVPRQWLQAKLEDLYAARDYSLSAVAACVKDDIATLLAAAQKKKPAAITPDGPIDHAKLQGYIAWLEEEQLKEPSTNPTPTPKRYKITAHAHGLDQYTEDPAGPWVRAFDLFGPDVEQTTR